MEIESLTIQVKAVVTGQLALASDDPAVNTFVVKAIAGKTKARTRQSRTAFEGTIET